ncbi:15038_t:CDS:2 [Entrophospora sp. SA101]|nr:15038_t:CDS:2 [Entrophospora sp. SA101]
MQSNTNGRISFLGSVALLVSSMTGPGLVTNSRMVDVKPMICVAIVIMLSATASLFLCEALSAIPGNNNFQKKIEFSSLSTLLISNKYKCLMMQCILFISIQSINIACIILSAQTMDSLMISLLGKTCGIGIYPDSGVFCVYKQLPDGSPFGDKTMLVTFVMPLGLMDLVDNVRIQIVLIFIVMSWIITFCFHGLNKEFVPIIGDDISQVVGTILLNYSFIITIPSWINDLNLSNQNKDEKDDYDDDGDDDNEIENGYYNKEYNMKDISIISENQKNWNSPFKISSLPPSPDSIVTDSAPTVLLIHKSKSSSSFDSCRLINSNNDNSLLRTSYDRYDYRRKEDNKDPSENEGNNSEGIGGSGDDEKKVF